MSKALTRRRFCGGTAAIAIMPFAGLAAETLPDGVEVVGCSIDQLRVVGEDAGFEVAVAFALHADTCTSKVRGADIGHRAVKDHYLEMNTWTESPFQF